MTRRPAGCEPTSPLRGRIETRSPSSCRRARSGLPIESRGGALRVAERVGGGTGFGPRKGKPEPYLCHTLCELGAEPLGRELDGVATFLRENPRQVIVVIVEDYVPPSTIETSFSSAGLTRYVAT